MTRRKKNPPDEKCPKCGCPELQSYARQNASVVMVYTSCPACSHVIQPAPPTRADTPELRPGCTSADYYEPTHTEAEQAVLDAMAVVHETTLRNAPIYCPAYGPASVAELARRGLKP